MYMTYITTYIISYNYNILYIIKNVRKKNVKAIDKIKI